MAPDGICAPAACTDAVLQLKVRRSPRTLGDEHGSKPQHREQTMPKFAKKKKGEDPDITDEFGGLSSAEESVTALGTDGMAEEGTPPPTATWDPEQVGAWVLGLDIPGKEAISQAVVSEEVDGDALLGFKDQIQVKAGLGISTGKANKLWAAIEELRTASAGGETQHGTGPAFAMLPRSSGTVAWTHASSLLQNTWTKKERYTFSRLVEVQEIQNLALQSRFDGYKASMRAGIVNGNELMLFHGCAQDAIESIARTGFLKTFQTSAAGSWQRYGPGFYFAMHASKSHEYPVTEMQALPPGKHFRTMILCKVARGNVLETRENMDGLQGSAPEGYDSIHGVATADGPLNYDELVVFAEEAILPYAVVTYEYIKHNITLPHGDGVPVEESQPEPAAEELFEVIKTGEIMTKEQLFEAMMQGSVTKSEVRSLQEAAAAARDALAASVAGATANAEVLQRGAAEIARVIDELGRNRAAVDSAIDEEIAAVRSALNTSLDRRSEELKAALAQLYDERHKALDTQRVDVAQQLQGQRTLCEAGVAAMEQSDRQVVERLAEAKVALQTARLKVPEVVPQREAHIHHKLDNATSLIAALQQPVAAFGEVGRPRPDLQSYADPKPVYSKGAAISPNVPVGEHLQGARFEAQGLPNGLAIDPVTGVLSGSPTEESDEAMVVAVLARNETGIAETTLRVQIGYQNIFRGGRFDKNLQWDSSWTVLTKISEIGCEDYHTALGSHGYSTGVHSWTIKVLKYGNTRLGVCTGNVPLNTRLCDVEHHALIYDSGANYCSLGKAPPDQVDGGFCSNDILRFVLDLNQGKMTVTKNGKGYTTFSGLAGHTWFPAINLDNKGEKMKLLVGPDQ
eukprot:COSAG02_NODE_138_length_34440_cov_16.694368_24_plen_855_part_00